MKKYIQHMPTVGFEAEQAEIQDTPGGKGRPPVIARGNRPIALKRPDIRGKRFSRQARILYETLPTIWRTSS